MGCEARILFIGAAHKCAYLIMSKSFWSRVEKIQLITKTDADLLHIVETDKSVMGQLYWLMFETIQAISATDMGISHECKEIVFCAKERWVQMHAPLHGKTFSLDPTA